MMRARYLIIVGDASSAAGRAALTAAKSSKQGDPALTRLVERPGLSVLADPALATIALENGIILGQLFRRDAAVRATQLSNAEQDSLRAGGSASLVRNYWGGYVATTWDARAARVMILRDPSGALPCYYLHLGSLTLIGSAVADLIRAASRHAEIDWSYIAEHLCFPHFRPVRTALTGVTELVAGTELYLAEGKSEVRVIWSPWDFTKDQSPEASIGARSDRLKIAIDQAVTGWASTFHHIVLNISGGLDSSIVAAALSRSNTPYTGINFVTNDATGDETPFAREVAAALDFRIVEAREQVGSIDISTSDAGHLPRPIARSFAQSSDRACLALADEVEADGFMGGGGGDNVFCFLQSPSPVADRLLVERRLGGIIATAADIAQIAECSALEVLWKAARRAWLRAPRYRWPRNDSFLSAKARSVAGRISYHPWLDAPKKSLPGKAAHIASLIAIQNHLEGFSRERVYPFVAPLMSQPVIEACLEIPTWLWFADGQNRIIAREAFRDRLPRSITHRRGKGTPGSFVAEIFSAHRPAIWTMLSEGCLASAGMLDLDAVRAALRDNGPVRGRHHTRIMDIVDVEAWLSAWS